MAKIGEVEEVDRGWEKLKANLRKVKSEEPVVDIGIVGNAAAAPRDDGLTNAAVGSFHEFGGANDRPPERSFLRSTLDAGRRRYEKIVERITKAFYENKVDLRDGLGLLGLRIAGDVDKRIRAGIGPELAESTIAKKTVGGKAGTTPLIDTGQLAGSITSVVRKASDAK